MTDEVASDSSATYSRDPSGQITGVIDWHVLSLPPAFALSQDQTLKLDLKLQTG